MAIEFPLQSEETKNTNSPAFKSSGRRRKSVVGGKEELVCPGAAAASRSSATLDDTERAYCRDGRGSTNLIASRDQMIPAVIQVSDQFKLLDSRRIHVGQAWRYLQVPRHDRSHLFKRNTWEELLQNHLT